MCVSILGDTKQGQLLLDHFCLHASRDCESVGSVGKTVLCG